MTLPSYFDSFLKDIRLSDKQDFRDAHTTLRELLEDDEDLGDIIEGTFLQGSYRRATAVKPEGDQKPDVDVVVATNLPSDSTTPHEALAKFEDFLNDNYEGAWEHQARSIAIVVGDVEMDLVITSAPSTVTKSFLLSEVIRLSSAIDSADFAQYEKFAQDLYDPNLVRFAEKAADPWKSEPLLIPDRDVKQWTPTDPLAQMAWTFSKNKATNGHYVNVVKALKWWKRREQRLPKYPKGYPLEHLIGQNCPDGIESVAEGVARTLEAIAGNYASNVLLGTKPVLPDHGVPEHDVFKRISVAEFKQFHEVVADAAKVARSALDEQVKGDSWAAWYDFFGDPFPKPDDESSKSLGERVAVLPAEPKPERFA